MKNQIVAINNVVNLCAAGDELLNRSSSLPGMGIIYGFSGLGKTTAATWYINQCHGVYVRAIAAWSPSAMLETIMQELDVSPKRSCSEKVNAIVEALACSGRPLFIDEADYVVQKRTMIETLRDLHDLSTSPVILIGMAGIQRKIRACQQLTGRLSQWVEFKPATIQDIYTLSKSLCEIDVEEDLLNDLHKKTGGTVRLIVTGLDKIEKNAKKRGMITINLQQ